MHNDAVLSQAFPARISAVDALVRSIEPKAANSAQLRAVASELDRVSPLYGRASTAVVYAAFADLIRIVALLVEWRTAVLNAEKEAERFLRAAKERHRQWQSEYESVPFTARLVEAAAAIPGASSAQDVEAICRAVSCTPLPVGVFAGDRLPMPGGEYREHQGQPEPPELAVAFLRFAIDDHPANEMHFLTPGELHDLEIEVRVSRWPEAADSLTLVPVTIEPKSSYEFPTFDFSRPQGDPPFRLQQRRRAVLRTPQGLQARPFEFKYTASFNPASAEQPIAVVGQRTLRIEGFDLGRSPITGYRAVDQKLLQVRNHLRRQALVTAADLDSVLKVLTPLCSLAGRAIQDALFTSTCSESQFQIEARNELRRVPGIASELEEHPHAAGGITDLSFRGIRVELKFTDAAVLTLDKCDKFAEQAAAYVVGTGKRVGILCVLDNSPKTSHAFPADEGIGLLTRSTDTGSEVHIVVVLIQGNLRRPSDLSR
jgi:hypothetical protein